MFYFEYGSRVIENERKVKLQKYARKVCNLLHAIVSFFVTLFLFVLFNLLLPTLVQHVNLTFVKMLALIQESAELLVAQSALPAISIAYEHSFCWVLAIAFACVYHVGLVFMALGSNEGETEKEKETYGKDSEELHAKVICSTISYKHKVCFLS